MEKIKDIIIETENFARIYDLCAYARDASEMISIIGEAGYGKSSCLERLPTDFPDSTFYITARPGTRPRVFYSQIINAIDDESYDPNIPIFHLINKAANLFTKDSRKKLLIIDETGKFTTYELEHLHWFRDMTKECTGIILSGPSSFEKDFLRWKRQNKRGIQEVNSRINLWVHLDPPTKEDVREIIHAYGITNREFISKFQNLKDLRILKSKIDLYLNGMLYDLYNDFQVEN